MFVPDFLTKTCLAGKCIEQRSGLVPAILHTAAALVTGGDHAGGVAYKGKCIEQRSGLVPAILHTAAALVTSGDHAGGVA